MTSCLLSSIQLSSEKGSVVIGKYLLTYGSKFFPFKVVAFSKGRHKQLERVTSL